MDQFNKVIAKSSIGQNVYEVFGKLILAQPDRILLFPKMTHIEFLSFVDIGYCKKVFMLILGMPTSQISIEDFLFTLN